jgi:hypothetical protein
MASMPMPPDAANPAHEIPPLRTITEPPHVSSNPYQEAYYEPSSQAPLAGFDKIQAGAVDLNTGRRTGEDFPDNGLWKQV